jgi:hypothetical protein
MAGLVPAIHVFPVSRPFHAGHVKSSPGKKTWVAGVERT